MRRALNQSGQHRLTQYELGSSPASTPQSERLRSVLRVRSRAISVPLTRNCTELAALDAICRGLSVWNYIRERFRIPLSPPSILDCGEIDRIRDKPMGGKFSNHEVQISNVRS